MSPFDENGSLHEKTYKKMNSCCSTNRFSVHVFSTGGFVRARSWRTAQTFRSSPTASCILSSSQRLLRKTPGATRVLLLISTALTPRRLRSTWKVRPCVFFLSLSHVSQTPAGDGARCLFVRMDRCIIFRFRGRTALWTSSPVSFYLLPF